jgi:hypothetical protein
MGVDHKGLFGPGVKARPEVDPVTDEPHHPTPLIEDILWHHHLLCLKAQVPEDGDEVIDDLVIVIARRGDGLKTYQISQRLQHMGRLRIQVSVKLHISQQVYAAPSPIKGFSDFRIAERSRFRRKSLQNLYALFLKPRK